MLGEPDRGDGVEPPLGDVAVVLVADRGGVPETLALDRVPPPPCLLLGERHADGLHAVVLHGVQHEAAPAAADVEEPLPALEVELAADQVELLLLRLLERGVRLRVDRAGVRHRRTEHPRVEGVADVVVVGDGVGVPPAVRVPQAAEADLLGRRRLPAQGEGGERAVEAGLVGEARAGDTVAGEPVERGVEVAAHLELAGDVGAGEAELAGRGHEQRHRAGRAHVEPDVRSSSPVRAAVVRRELHVDVGTHERREHLGQLHPSLLP